MSRVTVVGHPALDTLILLDRDDLDLRDATGGCAMDLLLGPADGLVNGSITYVLTPDGSREGWETAALGDRARALFVVSATEGALLQARADRSAQPLRDVQAELIRYLG